MGKSGFLNAKKSIFLQNKNKSYGNPDADHVGDKADCNQLKQQLMKSNIWAGDDNSKNWKSEFKGKFDEKNDPNCRGVMDDKLKADLRASHYQIGENGNFFLFKK